MTDRRPREPFTEQQLDESEAHPGATGDDRRIVVSRTAPYCCHQIRSDGPTHGAVFGRSPDTADAVDLREVNAQLCVHAHTDASQLVAEVRRLRGRVTELEEAGTYARSALAALCYDLENPGSTAISALFRISQATAGVQNPHTDTAQALATIGPRLTTVPEPTSHAVSPDDTERQFPTHALDRTASHGDQSNSADETSPQTMRRPATEPPQPATHRTEQRNRTAKATYKHRNPDSQREDTHPGDRTTYITDTDVASTAPWMNTGLLGHAGRLLRNVFYRLLHHRTRVQRWIAGILLHQSVPDGHHHLEIDQTHDRPVDPR